MKAQSWVKLLLDVLATVLVDFQSSASSAVKPLLEAHLATGEALNQAIIAEKGDVSTK